MIFGNFDIESLRETLSEAETTRAIALKNVLSLRGISVTVEEAKKIMNETGDMAERLNEDNVVSMGIH